MNKKITIVIISLFIISAFFFSGIMFPETIAIQEIQPIKLEGIVIP